MASNFSALWNMSFSWLGSLLNFKLPVFVGSSQLSTLDMILGTIGILITFAFIKSLLKSGFSISGKDLTGPRSDKITDKEFTSASASKYLDNLNLKSNDTLRLPK